MEEMGMIMDFISNNGFAIVVCLYCLIVNNRTVKENTEAVNKMVTLLDHMTGVKVGGTNE